jgi:outer membrane protein TolC
MNQPNPRRGRYGLTLLFAAACCSALPAAERALSLEEAIAEALSKNMDLQIEEVNRRIRESAVLVERKPFSWNLSASYLAQSIDRPQNTREFVATGGGFDPGTSPRIFEERNQDARIGLGKRLMSGTNLEFGTRFTSLDNTLNRDLPPSLFNPEYETFVGLTITQPLWRGFGRKVNEAGIRAALAAAEAAELLARIRAMTVTAETASRYYDLAFAVQNEVVRRKAVGLAEKLLERSRGLQEEGKATPGDILEAEVAYFQRQEEWIEATSVRTDRQNALLLLMTDGESELPSSVRPTSAFGVSYPVPERASILEKARNERLDIAYYRKLLEQATLLGVRARNTSRPQLDLTGSVGLNGLSGDFSGAFSEAISSQGPEYSIGLSFSVPLEREARQAEYLVSQQEVRKAELELQKQKALVALEIDTALSRVRSLVQRVATAAKGEEAALLNMSNEEKMLEEGRSDNFRVLVFQQEYSDASTRSIAARAELNKSVVGLWLAAGDIFERLGVTYQSAAPGAAPAAPARP